MALGRAFPIRAHLPKGPQGTVPHPPAIIISTARTRPYYQRQIVRGVIHAGPIVGAYAPPAFIAPHAKIVSHQARFRALIGRTPPRPHLSQLASAPPLPSGRIVSAARRRPYLERLPKRPHLAGPILGTPPEIAVLITGTTVFRPLPNSLQSRFVPPTLILPELLGSSTTSQPPLPPGKIISVAVISSRTQIGRRAKTRVPSLASPGPLPVGKVVSTAVSGARSRTGRQGHVRLPLANLISAGPGAKIISTAVASARAQLGRGGKVLHAKPITGITAAQPPVAPGTFVSQATKRPFVGRMPIHPRLPALGATTPTIVKKVPVRGQAIKRMAANRPTPRPHLAGPIILPFIPPTYVLKYVRRRTTGISPTKVLVAPPIVGSYVPQPPVATRPYIVSQAIPSHARRYLPAPHVATKLLPPSSHPTRVIAPVLVGQGKSNPGSVLVVTPSAPAGLFPSPTLFPSPNQYPS